MPSVGRSYKEKGEWTWLLWRQLRIVAGRGNILYLPLPSAASAVWTSLLHWAPPEPLVYPSQYQTPGLYICAAKGNINRWVSLRNVSIFQCTKLCPCCNINYTHCVVAVLEAHVLNHDNWRRNLPTGRKIKWQSLLETEAGFSTMTIIYMYHNSSNSSSEVWKPLPNCTATESFQTTIWATPVTHTIIVPCHSQLFQSSLRPPSSAVSSLCSVPVVPALQSRDQTWLCNSRGEGCKKNNEYKFLSFLGKNSCLEGASCYDPFLIGGALDVDLF